MNKLIIFICLNLFGYGYSQFTYNLGVEELFEKGVRTSTKIRASKIKSDISVEKENLTKIKRLPQIGLTASNGYVGKPTIYNTDLSYLGHPKMPDWQQKYSLELSQPIYEGGKIKNTIKEASLERQIAELDLEKDISDIKLFLIKNYLDLFRLYKQKEVLEENIKEAEKNLHNIQNLKNQGIVTNNDVLRNQIVVSNYQLSLNETRDDINIISQQLDIVLGFNENYIIIPDMDFLEKEFVVNLEEYYVKQSYENYPQLKISKFNIEKAKIDEKIAKSKYLPILTLNAGNNLTRPITSTSPAQDLYLNSWGITLGLTYNLSSWFDHKYTMNQAKYNIDLQENIKEQTEQSIRINIKSFYTKHLEAVNRVEVLMKTVEQAKDNYRITNNKYYNQLAILTDLLDASSVQLNAELQLTLAKANSIYTYYQLLNASGNL
ncbi:TolC family protein [Apibacter sp. HY039]|uniref:TolC family protein n=1 Tax=Apibacter sp. HY039 TaxID=2501476 RepID=UPI000FEB7B79|nr:TolC family protein [Apibacter sp. HY039]